MNPESFPDFRGLFHNGPPTSLEMIANPIIISNFARTTVVKAIIMDLYSSTDNAILKRLGEQLRRLRLEQNVSQKDLAKSAGVSLSSVVNIEKGKSISLSTLIPLLRALNSLDLLSGFTKDPELSPIAYAKLIDGQKEKKRASSSKNSNKTIDSEW